MKIGLALIPSENAIEQVLAVQQIALRYSPLAPILSRQKNLPHVTLLQGDVDERYLTQATYTSLLDSIGRVCNPDSAIRFTSADYIERGWYFLTIFRTEHLVALHDTALKSLGTLLNQPGIAESAVPSHYTSMERANFLRYGYRYVGDAFSPHITLGRSETGRNEVLLQIIRSACESRLFAQPHWMTMISVYAMGDNGSHAETLASMPIDDGGGHRAR